MPGDSHTCQVLSTDSGTGEGILFPEEGSVGCFVITVSRLFHTQGRFVGDGQFQDMLLWGVSFW